MIYEFDVYIMVKWIVVIKIQPSICFDDTGNSRKNSSQFGRHRYLISGSLEYESSMLPLSYLVRHSINCCDFYDSIMFLLTSGFNMSGYVLSLVTLIVLSTLSAFCVPPERREMWPQCFSLSSFQMERYIALLWSPIRHFSKISQVMSHDPSRHVSILIFSLYSTYNVTLRDTGTEFWWIFKFPYQLLQFCDFYIVYSTP